VISSSLVGQNLRECGMDNDPQLNQTEANFLNGYLNDDQRKGTDFTDKKVLFITGTKGDRFGTKSEYFDYIKEWKKKGNQIATWVVELNSDQTKKLNSAGYDVIVTYWAKLLTQKRKQIIVSEINAGR